MIIFVGSSPLLIAVTTLTAVPFEISVFPRLVPLVLARLICNIYPEASGVVSPAVIFTVFPKFWVMLYVVELSVTGVRLSDPAVPVVIVSGAGSPEVVILYTALTASDTFCVAVACANALPARKRPNVTMANISKAFFNSTPV